MSPPSNIDKAEQSAPIRIDAASEHQTPSAGGSDFSAIVAQLSLDVSGRPVGVIAGDSGTQALDYAPAVNSTPRTGGNGSSSSTALYTPPFARGDDGDDVFKTTSASAASPTPSGRNTDRQDFIRRSTNWRSGSSSGDSSAGSPSTERPANNRTAFGGNKSITLVRADEAQGVYPPSCCVFVANLLQTEGEETLQMAVTQVFREFGPVFVKIRRDEKQMPFAFCQYTVPEHADRAIKEGRGRLIKGRPCRCEKAKAPRLFFVERKFGAVVTPMEARQLLAPYGIIDFCYTASNVERTALNLNEGVIVQFQLYDDGQKAQSAFRNHDMWKLVAIAGMNSSARSQIRSSPSATDAARAYLSRYETDRRSIFVGNLPVGITEDGLGELFEPYGKVEEIVLHQSASKFEPSEKLFFAFIQFEAAIDVSKVLAVKTCFVYQGRCLRISQKDSENNGLKRPARGFDHTPSAAYAYPSPASSARPAHGPAQQPASPMSMAPPAYGYSPYAYPPFGSPYHYPPGSVYSDGQHYYHPPTYAGYYSYPATPAYDATASSTVQVAGTPSAAQPYYSAYAGYPGYQYSPQTYWGMTGSAAGTQPYASPAAYPPVYPTYPAVVSSVVADDRSATLSPLDHGAAATEDVLESQETTSTLQSSKST